MFDPTVWARVPFEFWAAVFFIFGCLWGSFLNVVIYRLPRGESVVHPPSHCPHCRYSIPWYLNMPLVTWLYLRGRCANCQAPISVRYFLVELLTGVAFLATWLQFGRQSPWVALIYCLVLAGFIAATFIDFEHYIIPDEITIGGIGAGLICSLLVPVLHGTGDSSQAMKRSALGILVGAGSIYAIVRLGKLLFGKRVITFTEPKRILFLEEGLWLPADPLPWQDLLPKAGMSVEFSGKNIRLRGEPLEDAPIRLHGESISIGDQVFPLKELGRLEATTACVTQLRPSPHLLFEGPESTVVLTEGGMQLPDEEIKYGELFYRPSDTIILQASKVVLGEKTYEDVPFRLTQNRLFLGGEELDTDPIQHLEVTTERLILPREAMGLGDVKFMAAIGAFLGWPAVVFTLFASSVVGAVVGLLLGAMKKTDRGQIPFGPYIALGAVIWMFGGHKLFYFWWRHL